MTGEEQQEVQTTRDDEALFKVTGILIEALGQTRDERIAMLVEHAIRLCKEDESLVAKLLVKAAAKDEQQRTAPEPYNPFARAYK